MCYEKDNIGAEASNSGVGEAGVDILNLMVLLGKGYRTFVEYWVSGNLLPHKGDSHFCLFMRIRGPHPSSMLLSHFSRVRLSVTP